jgi:hypothetical protein
MSQPTESAVVRYSPEQNAAILRMAAHAAEFPIRQSTPAEDALRAEYMADHGDDPAEWSPATLDEYRSKLAALRGAE